MSDLAGEPMGGVVLVDPERLLLATLDGPVSPNTLGPEQTLVVVFCGYAHVTDQAGRRCIAIELVWDPNEQAPGSPYTSHSCVRAIVPPARLTKVRPYTC